MNHGFLGFFLISLIFCRAKQLKRLKRTKLLKPQKLLKLLKQKTLPLQKNSKMSSIKIIECPRDAMQGIHDFIPTDIKVEYVNALLKVGFDTLDCGSFVSPKAIPQMRDTHSVLSRLQLQDTQTKLLTIVANERGATTACDYDEIHYLGYPFSISETFQQRNTKKSIEESVELVERMLNLCQMHAKSLVVYVSMAFGNPYDDFWDVALLEHWVDRLVGIGVEILSLSDTVGVAQPEIIANTFDVMTHHYPKVEFGAHFHTTPETWEEKVNAAFAYGCHRFDGAIKGYGGCPMAKDDLVGNMPTEKLLGFFEEKNVNLNLNMEAFQEAMAISKRVFVV